MKIFKLVLSRLLSVTFGFLWSLTYLKGKNIILLKISYFLINCLPLWWAKGMWKMDYHEKLQILYFMQWQEKILSVWLPKVFQSEQISLSPDIFWYVLLINKTPTNQYSDWIFFSQGVIWWVWSFWTSFAQKILNLFLSWKCFHVGASYVMMICINTYIE